MMKKVLLLILDGWGIAKDTSVSAVNTAHTPFIDGLYQTYPNSFLSASGTDVGLPQGQMGNSEVGHLNIGAGRTVYQMLQSINISIQNGAFAKNEVLLNTIKYAHKNKKAIHCTGLLSDGGVHSHINHLYHILHICKKHNIPEVFIHAITDGRDTDPHSGIHFLQQLKQETKKIGIGRLASICGRYYAMDRDNRWERTNKYYQLIVKGIGNKASDPLKTVQTSYQHTITDEFIEPIVIVNDETQSVTHIQKGDVLINFNFRTDRSRQISMALTQKDIYPMKRLEINYLTMTCYDSNFKNIPTLFERENLKNTLGEVLSKNGKTQVRIAETEKYPHVTFFFSGGREAIFPKENRIMCPSPKVATYDLKPEMSIFELTQKTCEEILLKTPDFICLNFANPDMVGHTGVFQAAVKACEAVDQCTAQIVKKAISAYHILIIADHGNAEYMRNPDGSANTAHTTNLVPSILVSHHFNGELKNGILANVAPTILELMNIEKPVEMTANSLLKKI